MGRSENRGEGGTNLPIVCGKTAGKERRRRSRRRGRTRGHRPLGKIERKESITDCGLIFKQMESFSVKLPEAMCRHGTKPRVPEFSSACEVEWLLNNPDAH